MLFQIPHLSCITQVRFLFTIRKFFFKDHSLCFCYFKAVYLCIVLVNKLLNNVFLAVLPIIVNLLLNARAKEEHREQVDELTMVFLSDLTILLNSNLDNKR